MRSAEGTEGGLNGFASHVVAAEALRDGKQARGRDGRNGMMSVWLSNSAADSYMIKVCRRSQGVGIPQRGSCAVISLPTIGNCRAFREGGAAATRIQ